MYFGLLPIQTHIVHCLSISYIQTTQGYLGTTCGRDSRPLSIELGTMMQTKLIDSMLSVLSMLRQLTHVLFILRFGLAPCWRGLNRFPQVMQVSFNDGAKFENMSKVCVGIIQK